MPIPREGTGAAPHALMLPGRLTLALILLMYCSIAQAIDVEGNFTKLPTGLSASYFLDEDNSFDINDMMNLPNEQWTSSSSETQSFGFSNGQLWIKLKVHSQLDHSQRMGLEIGYPVLDLIKAYITKDNQVIQQYTTGDTVPFDQRPIHFYNIMIPFELASGESTTLYLAVTSEGSLQVPMTLWNLDYFFTHQQTPFIGHGLYYGIILVMTFYNLFIYLSVRHPSYLYYVLTLISYGILAASLQGLGFQYLWPQQPQLNSITVPVSVGIANIAISLFSISLLSLRTTSAPLFKFHSGLIFTHGVILALGLTVLPYHIIIQAQMVAGICTLFSALATGVILLLKGIRVARFYVLAWASGLVGILLMCMAKFGLIPTNAIIESSIQWGPAIEVILLSFALADRINEERRAKLRAETIARQNEKRANEENQRYLKLKYQTKLDELSARQEVIQAQAESKAKSEFMATMSHEIRTPMNGVLGMSDLLQETQLDDTQRSYLNVITNSGRALLNIINDILDYSKIAAGKMEIEQVNFDLKQLCLECASVFTVTAEHKQVELDCCITPDTPTLIQSDPSRLRQIIINLLGNAFKFTHAGKVSLEVQQVAAEGEQLTLRFQVRDTGIGIAKDKLNILFKEFSQADSSISREYGGTGLGLSIAKRLTELMGGEIGIESEVGVGSCFWFTIQCRPADADFVGDSKRQDHSQDERDDALADRQVLVAEDNAVNQLVIKGMLNKLGVKYEIVTNGQEALDCFTRRAAEFDLILMDCEMPVMDGYHASRRIREHEQQHHLAHTPIVALTAHALPEHQQKATESGMDGHIPKPVDLHTIKATLQQVTS